MAESGAVQATRVVPLMRYRDLPNAIAWLSEAFGFEVHYTATDDDDALIYAQMTYGHGMVMLGPVRDSDFDDLLSQPDEIGGTETQSCYLVVQDIEGHFERAKEAGAEIALDVQRDDTGGRAYSCRDCEGHLWNFGTFDPWQSAPGGSTALTPVTSRIQAGPISMARSAAAVFAGLAIAGVAIGVYTHHQVPEDHIANIRVVDPDEADKDVGVAPPSAPVRVVSALRKQLQQERAARREAEQRLATTRRELAEQQSKSQEAVSTTRRVTEELAAARGAEQAALAAVERLRAQRVGEMRVATTSETELQKLIDDERRAKNEALKAIEAIKYELVRERQLRQQAEREANVALGSSNDKTAGTKPRVTAPVTKAPAQVKAEPAKLPVKPAADKVDVPAKKVTAIEPPSKSKATAQPKVSTTPKQETKPKVETKKAKKRVRRKVTKKVVKKKAPKKKSNGISKGWPYNTW